ncbi:outer membrane protein assembly factor BamD [Flagellatimonas centrodinii]|uniref:outer membrane protein assembly factor BamD n=1 Tax=Flagellatimonas centrodinii TaxID=2806210 RepID=UPI001FEEEA4E|nr:outer membrane protein assembly factor BamD [Flagellatimonas centrodinii]ULQ45337.1 outer membrane protein assembly factor BamD [Flagellatimonas centrodinii]
MTAILRFLGFAIVLATLGACASKGGTALPPDNPFGPDRVSQRELRLEATELYRASREALISSDFATAISRYDMLITRYPFSVFSTQAELERVYAYYRNFEVDRALAAADRFLRDHPRHDASAYVHYLKGLINQSRGDRVLTGLGVDTTRDDVTYARRAFDDFALLVQKYPDSPYVGDARQRMVELRNRIASHELHIVRFYVKRGAFLAAARRAESLVATYPGAPAAAEALALMERSYRTLGLDAQADATETLLRGNGLPTAADLGEREVEPGLLQRISTTIGGWFGIGDDADEALGV